MSEGDRKVFVQGLPWAATEDEVRDFFKGCGEMESVRLACLLLLLLTLACFRGGCGGVWGGGAACCPVAALAHTYTYTHTD